ncbi:MAG: DUF4252 domain-containing protein [Bacteroidota bacterium]
MKYLITSLLLLVLFPAPAAAQKVPTDAISAFFSEYVDDPTFDVVYVSGKVFELFRGANIEIDELGEEELEAILAVVQDIEGIRLLHTDRRAKDHWMEAKNRIPTDQYELLFKVRTRDGTNVEAFIQDENAAINELFLLVGADQSFAMLSFVGVIDLKQLSKLQDALDD